MPDNPFGPTDAHTEAHMEQTEFVRRVMDQLRLLREDIGRLTARVTALEQQRP